MSLEDYRIHFEARHRPAAELLPRQFGKQKAAWARDAVRVERVEPGRLAIGVVFSVQGKTISCRTPRLSVNPAAALMITTLGGELPTD